MWLILRMCGKRNPILDIPFPIFQSGSIRHSPAHDASFSRDYRESVGT
jgi:hypothetical protein